MDRPTRLLRAAALLPARRYSQSMGTRLRVPTSRRMPLRRHHSLPQIIPRRGPQTGDTTARACYRIAAATIAVQRDLFLLIRRIPGAEFADSRGGRADKTDLSFGFLGFSIFGVVYRWQGRKTPSNRSFEISRPQSSTMISSLSPVVYTSAPVFRHR